MRRPIWMPMLGALTAIALLAVPRSFGQDAAAAKERAQKLIAVLQSADASLFDKHSACRELSVVGDREAVPVLARLLGDEKLSHMARYALEPIPDPSVDAALRDAAGTVKGRILAGVLNSIGKRRDASAVEILARLVRDPDPEVAAAAATALGNIGTPAAARVLQQAKTDAPEAAREAVLDGCLRCADSLLSQGRRDEAIAMYDSLRGAAVPGHVRAAGARGSILARHPRGVALLLEQLRSDDQHAFAMALRLAQELPGKETTDALAGELGKLGPEKQPLLLLALGNRKDAAALPAIVSAMKSGDAEVRVAAIRAATQLASASVVPVLFKLAGQEDAEVAQAARVSLATLGGNDVDQAILAMASDENAQTRRVAVDVVGQRRLMGAIPVLLRAAGDADAQVRLAAIRALGEVGGAEEVAALGPLLLQAKTAQELEAAERALAAAGARAGDGDKSAEQVIALLPQAEGAQKRALLRVLRSLGGAKALEAVRMAARNGDAETRDAAVRILCDWPTADAAEDLLALAKTSENATYRLLAFRGYIRLIGQKDLSDEKRLAMCKEALPLAQREEEKRLVLGALSGIGLADALAIATSQLENAAIRDEAAAAAVSIGEKVLQKDRAAVAQAMRKVLDSVPSPEVAARARGLLERAEK